MLIPCTSGLSIYFFKMQKANWSQKMQKTQKKKIYSLSILKFHWSRLYRRNILIELLLLLLLLSFLWTIFVKNRRLVYIIQKSYHSGNLRNNYDYIRNICWNNVCCFVPCIRFLFLRLKFLKTVKVCKID